jgi:hypothetical protein
MDNQLRIRFKIGDIEFEAEGSSNDVERERESFKNTLLPLAIDAMVQTRGIFADTQYIEAKEQPILLTTETQDTSNSTKERTNDLSRTSLSSFIKNYGVLNDQDFVLIAAYFDEKKNNMSTFTSESIKQYYADARRSAYSNNSLLLNRLVQKGFIMDDPKSEGKNPKQYILTDDGILYVESYVPKEGTTKKSISKARKARTKGTSIYDSLNADNFNLKNYPEIKSQDTFKKQMLLTLYIVSNDGHGDAFSTTDVQCLMTDKLGLHTTIDKINGVFKREKKWFTPIADETRKGSIKHRLLEGAKDFAKSIIDGTAN